MANTVVKPDPGRFMLAWLDVTEMSPTDNDQIKDVWTYVFQHDIGLTFDPALDADFTDPVKYYSMANRGAYAVVRDLDDNDRIVGTAALRHLKELGNQAELKRMFFLPVCRGHNLATALALMIIEMATLLHFDAIVLDTKVKLAVANRVYDKLGFCDCENYNNNPRADRFMRLKLDRLAVAVPEPDAASTPAATAA
jgi:GNAT superfamily N-acetyltransferase